MKSPTEHGTNHSLQVAGREQFAPRGIDAQRQLHAQKQQTASKRKARSRGSAGGGEDERKAGADEAPSAPPTLAGRSLSRDELKLQFFHTRRAV